MVGFIVFMVLVFFNIILAQNGCCETQEISTWHGSWRVFPTSSAWSMETRIPMTNGE